MFGKKDDSDLNDAIQSAYAFLAGNRPESPEYAAIADQLTKLYALKESNSKMRVSPDTLAIVAANLLGIVTIVGHERINVVTSKALSFVMKATR